MKVVLKSKVVKYAEHRDKPTSDDKFEYFKKLINDHLNALDGEGDDESFHALEKAGFPVGTVRIHKDGVKRIKIAPGKWRPKYEGHTRGAKMAIAAIKRKVNSAKNSKELMDIVMENRDRFIDKEGHLFPFVQELHTYVSEKDDLFAKKETPGKKKGRIFYDPGKPKRGQAAAARRKPEMENEKKNRKPQDVKKIDPGEQLYKEGEKIDFEMGGVKYSGTVERVMEFHHKKGNEIGYSTKVEGKAAGFMVYNKDIVDAKKTPPSAPKSENTGKIDFQSIREKYQSAKSFEGEDDEVFAGKETVAGKWKLVEADTPTASHDESTFHKTPGFPTNADGSSINDRDYEHFQANKEAVINIASEFDGRALKFDNPVIVTKDGIVISGNNRTMSSKIAARKGTDKKYIEALKKRARKFGFTEEQVSRFKNPRVVFEVENDGGYTTEQFAKFNESTKKTMGPTERAIKVSKIMKPETIETVAGMIGEYDTMGDLYKDQKASQKLIKTFQDAGLIGQNAEGEFVENGVITPAGKSFIETALLGSVVNEVNLRGFNRPGCLSIRQTMVRSLASLVENKGLSGYSINKELNEAIDIAMQVAIEKDKFKSVEDWAKQKNMFEEPPDETSIELAKKLEGTQKAFAQFMQDINAGLKVGANGEADIFLGGVETKEQILSRFLGLKKSIMAAIDFFRNRFMKKSNEYRQLAVEGINPYSEKLDMLKYGEKAIAVDFDGVINSFKNGWKGPTETDEPVLSAAESIATLFHRGYKIIIFSTRAGTEEGVKTIREYLLKHTEDPELVEKIEITDKKPIAHIYIDDRAIPFTGDWAETLKQIDEFKPWTERPVPTYDQSSLFSKSFSLEDYKKYFPKDWDPTDRSGGCWKDRGTKGWLTSPNPDDYDSALWAVIQDYLKDHYNLTANEREQIASIVSNAFWAGNRRGFENARDIDKSLTWSGHKLEDRYKVQGMDISIENKKGSTRSGTDKDGHEWNTKMHYDYGYIRGTVGKDKDHLDCYVGPDRESERVFIVHQNDPVTGAYDEDKVMLGFDSENEARKAYLSQYDRPGFLGDIAKMGIEEFKKIIFDENNKGRKIEGGSADEN
jgi:hypothetical protein